MARSVNQVQRITFVVHLYRVALDGDAAFFLQVHIVEYLVLHIFLLDRAGHLQHAVCQRTLTVVYMRYNAEISYIFHLLFVLPFGMAHNFAAKLQLFSDICKKNRPFERFFYMYLLHSHLSVSSSKGSSWLCVSSIGLI